MTTDSKFDSTKIVVDRVVDLRFDHGYIDAMIFAELEKKKPSLKHVAKSVLNNFDIHHNQFNTGANPFIPELPIKENNSMSTKLLSPTETIERKDLSLALSICDSRDEDNVMHAVALVQGLAEGQALIRGWGLKNHHIGRTIEIIDTGERGYLSDFKQEGMMRNDRCNAVIDGKMVEITRGVYVILEPADASAGSRSMTFVQNNYNPTPSS